jgi:hypothetical protein
MKRAERLGDMETGMERFMINLFKKRLREDSLDLNNLEGTWSEVRAILEVHFGRVTRAAAQNEFKLVNLFRIAIDEMKANQN